MFPENDGVCFGRLSPTTQSLHTVASRAKDRVSCTTYLMSVLCKQAKLDNSVADEADRVSVVETQEVLSIQLAALG